MSHLRDEGSIVTVTPPPVLTDDIVTSILQSLEGCLMLTAIFWLEPPPVTHQVFANASDARAWARWQINPKMRP